MDVSDLPFPQSTPAVLGKNDASPSSGQQSHGLFLFSFVVRAFRTHSFRVFKISSVRKISFLHFNATGGILHRFLLFYCEKFLFLLLKTYFIVYYLYYLACVDCVVSTRSGCTIFYCILDVISISVNSSDTAVITSPTTPSLLSVAVSDVAVSVLFFSLL